jgi:hypothetical protein
LAHAITKITSIKEITVRTIFLDHPVKKVLPLLTLGGVCRGRIGALRKEPKERDFGDGV